MSENTERSLDSLQEKLLRLMPEPGLFPVGIAGLRLHRKNEPAPPNHCLYNPLVIVVIQGFKRSIVGNQELRYGRGHYMITGVDMPSISNVTQATPEEPFLSVTMDLDRAVIGQLLLETPKERAVSNIRRGMSVSDAETDLLIAIERMVDLLDKPADLKIMVPLISKEIHYRLLTGPQGDVLRQLNTPGSQSNQIVEAVSWLRENYREPLRIEDLAARASMSPSTLHRQFKKVTTISPLQYQKRLRLHAARRLMLLEDMDANSASLAVGYESPQQFNREYKRLFGQPPRRDVKRL